MQGIKSTVNKLMFYIMKFFFLIIFLFFFATFLIVIFLSSSFFFFFLLLTLYNIAVFFPDGLENFMEFTLPRFILLH